MLIARALEASIPVGLVLCGLGVVARLLFKSPHVRYLTLYVSLLLVPAISAGHAIATRASGFGAFTVDLRWLAAFWAAGLCIALVRVALSIFSLRRFVRASVPLEVAWLDEVVRRISQQFRLRRLPTVRACAKFRCPCTVGILKPLVLIPTAALARLSPAELEAVVAHELAHIRRYDYLANLVQLVVESLLFFHPGVWMLSHLVRLEREACCDDLAVRAVGDRDSYARALLATANLSGPLAAPAFTSEHLAARIATILGRRGRVRLESPRLAMASLVTLILLATFAVVTAKPLMVDGFALHHEGERLVISLKRKPSSAPIFLIRSRGGAERVVLPSGALARR